MILKAVHKIPLFKKIISTIINRWVTEKVSRVISFIDTKETILDIGSGNCLVANYLIENDFSITTIDVKNLSVVKKITPIVYDGKKLPFTANSFDTSLLLTVLHHSDSPENLIKEAVRVSENIVIIEDTYNSKIQKIATQFVDLIVNFGHSKMTYQNKTELDWENTFKNNELTILYKKRKSVLLFFQQTTYYLTKSE